MNKNLFSLPDVTNNDSVLKELIALRRILHRTPETGFHEWKTMELLIDLIKDTQGTITFMPQETAQHLCTLIPKADKPHKFLDTDVTVTGFKLTFNLDPQNKKVKKHLAIRSDIDGLSIPENSDPRHLPAKLGFNAVNGAMHACGHDGHMAIALMSALWVNANLSFLYESDLSAISFIFQPAEEGCRGALAVIDSGFLQDIDLIYSEAGRPADRLQGLPHATPHPRRYSRLRSLCRLPQHGSRRIHPHRHDGQVRKI